MSLLGAGGLGDIVAYIGIGGDTAFISKMRAVDTQVQKSAHIMNAALNAALIAGTAAFVGSVAAAAKFESSFTGVTKTVDGLRDSYGNLNLAGQQLSNQFRQLALDIPLSVNELNKIGELGGQLGIPRQELIKFTDTIARLGVTTDLSTESAAQSMARFVNITQKIAPEGLSASEQIERLGSTVVDLGNNFATTESQILEMSMRIAGAGATVGLTQSQILGLATALSSVGIEAQMGGSSISRAMIAMAQAVETGGSKLAAFASVANMTSSDFVRAFKDNAGAAISAFIVGLGKVKDTGGNTFKVLEELDLTDIRLTDSMLRASNASDLFTTALASGAKAYQENNALAKESAQRFATFESQLAIVKNIIMDLAIDLGNEFLPKLKDVLQNISQNKDKFVDLISILGKALIAFGALSAVIKIIQGITVAIKALGTISALSLGPLGIALAGVTAAYIALRKITDKHVLTAAEESRSVHDLVKQYESLKNNQNRTQEETEAMVSASLEIEKALAKQGIAISDLSNGYGDYIKQLDEVLKRDVESKIEKLRKKLGELDGQTASTGETLFVTVDGLKRLDGGATQNSNTMSKLQKEYLKTQNALKYYESQLAEINSQTDENTKKKNALAEAEKNLAALNIETTASIKNQIKKLEELRVSAGSDSVAVAQINSQIDALKNKLNAAAGQAGKASDSLKLLHDAHVKTSAAIEEQMQAYRRLVPAALNDEEATKDLAGKMETLWNETDRARQEMDIYGVRLLSVTSNTDALKESAYRLANNMGGMAQVAFDVSGGFEGLEKNSKKLTYQLKINNDAFGEAVGQLNTLWREFGNGDEVINKTIDALYSLSRGDYFGAVIHGLKALEGALTTTGHGIQEVMTKLNDFLSIKASENGAVFSLRQALDAMIKSGQGASDILENIETKLMGLFDEFAGNDFDELLSGLGIERESDIRALIKSYEDLFLKLEVGSFEYEQIRDKIESLYDKLGERAPWQAQEDAIISAKQQISGWADEISNLIDYISDLENQKIEIDVQLERDLEEPKRQLGALKSLLLDLSQNSDNVDFYWIAKQLEEITGKSSELIISWGEMLDIIFQDYSQFEKDLKTATKAIEDILYFKIDLDATGADEQINALIFRMRDYLKTLTPGSQAYIDAKKGLDELIKKFLEMGGVLDEELALQFNKDQITTEIGAVSNQISQLTSDAATKKANIDIEIGAAKNKISILQSQIDLLVAKMQKEYSIKIDTGAAYNNLNKLLLLLSSTGGDVAQIPVYSGEFDISLDSYHSGGIIEAHDGLMLNSREVPIKALLGESVLNPGLTANIMRSGGDINAANKTKDPSRLYNEKMVIVYNPGPKTHAEIIDREYYPRIRATQRYREAPGSPF